MAITNAKIEAIRKQLDEAIKAALIVAKDKVWMTPACRLDTDELILLSQVISEKLRAMPADCDGD